MRKASLWGGAVLAAALVATLARAALNGAPDPASLVLLGLGLLGVGLLGLAMGRRRWRAD